MVAGNSHSSSRVCHRHNARVISSETHALKLALGNSGLGAAWRLAVPVFGFPVAVANFVGDMLATYAIFWIFSWALKATLYPKVRVHFRVQTVKI